MGAEIAIGVIPFMMMFMVIMMVSANNNDDKVYIIECTDNQTCEKIRQQIIEQETQPHTNDIVDENYVPKYNEARSR